MTQVAAACGGRLVYVIGASAHGVPPTEERQLFWAAAATSTTSASGRGHRRASPANDFSLPGRVTCHSGLPVVASNALAIARMGSASVVISFWSRSARCQRQDSAVRQADNQVLVVPGHSGDILWQLLLCRDLAGLVEYLERTAPIADGGCVSG